MRHSCLLEINGNMFSQGLFPMKLRSSPPYPITLVSINAADRKQEHRGRFVSALWLCF